MAVDKILAIALDRMQSLERRINVLEQVIREDLQPEDCTTNEANRMIVEDIHKMKLSFAERHSMKV